VSSAVSISSASLSVDLQFTDLLGMTVKSAPNWPKCVQPMRLNHIVPIPTACPNSKPSCNEVTTEAIEDAV